VQTDILKEYIAQKEWIFPPRPHLRLIGDLIEFCATEVPKFHPISVSGYHIREAGSTAAQELAFTLADGFSYVELGRDRGLDIDRFSQGLSFFFNAHIDFFEEIAKYRAARRIWARWLRDRYGAKQAEALRLRFHTQTAGVSLTAQQPENNIVRTAIEALAAVLGGTQSLHTNALDEVLALPTEKTAQIALRTQQIIALETGAANVIDPLGGSYFVEALTDRMEELAEEYFAKIDQMGQGSMLEGMLVGIERGFFQGEIADAAFREQSLYEKGRLVKVGVNEFVDPDHRPGDGGAADRHDPAHPRGPRQRGGDEVAGGPESGSGRRRQPHAAAGRLRQGLRDRRRDRRLPAPGLRRVHRDPAVLISPVSRSSGSAPATTRTRPGRPSGRPGGRRSCSR
jgi:isobutyryl-CoA mutase large subunit